MGEADHGAYEHRGAFEGFLGEEDVVGLYAGRGYGILFGDLETGVDVVVRHGGVKEGVVDHAGEVGEGDVESFGAGGCHGEWIVKGGL